jgi:hypothetical protein
MAIETAYLAALLVGIAFLVAAVGTARWNWRNDIPAFGRRTNVLDVLSHPERYAEPGRASLIRALGVVGALFVLTAAALLVYQWTVDAAR